MQNHVFRSLVAASLGIAFAAAPSLAFSARAPVQQQSKRNCEAPLFVPGHRLAPQSKKCILNRILIDHIVISEVYYDVDASHGTEAKNEWVELYNPTEANVDLSGWSISDEGSADIIPADTILRKHSYAVITNSTSTAAFWRIPQNALVIALDSPIGNGLNNTGDALYLTNSTSTIVDAISWGGNDTVLNPPIRDVAEGNSLARKNFFRDTDTARDWTRRRTPKPGR